MIDLDSTAASLHQGRQSIQRADNVVSGADRAAWQYEVCLNWLEYRVIPRPRMIWLHRCLDYCSVHWEGFFHQFFTCVIHIHGLVVNDAIGLIWNCFFSIVWGKIVLVISIQFILIIKQKYFLNTSVTASSVTYYRFPRSLKSWRKTANCKAFFPRQPQTSEKIKKVYFR